MVWPQITTEGSIVGLFTQIVGTEEYLGWVCQGVQETAGTDGQGNVVTTIGTQCTSEYVSQLAYPAPDFTTSSTDQVTFICYDEYT